MGFHLTLRFPISNKSVANFFGHRGYEIFSTGFMSTSLGVCKLIIKSLNFIIIMHTWLKFWHWPTMINICRVGSYKWWMNQSIAFLSIIFAVLSQLFYRLYVWSIYSHCVSFAFCLRKKNWLMRFHLNLSLCS
mgnify:FL=1